jgi:hypothetical protein
MPIKGRTKRRPLAGPKPESLTGRRIFENLHGRTCSDFSRDHLEEEARQAGTGEVHRG